MSVDVGEQLGFDLESLLPPPPPPLHTLPAPTLFTSTARGEDADREWRQWQRDYGQLGSLRRSHAWRPAPGSSTPAIPGHDLAMTSCDLRCDCPHDVRRRGSALSQPEVRCQCVGDDLLYRAECWSCDWTGPVRTCENDAAEDLVDHTHPTWRELDLPVVEKPRPEETKARAKWDADVAARYPDGWLESGGPMLSARRAMGTRHVPGRAPGGGYDLAVLVDEVGA